MSLQGNHLVIRRHSNQETVYMRPGTQARKTQLRINSTGENIQATNQQGDRTGVEAGLGKKPKTVHHHGNCNTMRDTVTTKSTTSTKDNIACQSKKLLQCNNWKSITQTVLFCIFLINADNIPY